MFYGVLILAIILLLYKIEERENKHQLEIKKKDKKYRDLIKVLAFSDKIYLLSDELTHGKESLKTLKDEGVLAVSNGEIYLQDNCGNRVGSGIIFVDKN